MTAPRRIVTGRDTNGDSVVVSDGPTPATHDFASIPGMRTSLVWATAPGAPWAGAGDPTVGLTRDLAGRGESRFVVVTFPPDAVYAADGFDPDAAAAEQRRVSPGLAECFEPAAPGMHTTDTVDYAIVLSGRIELELDNGVRVGLAPGDTVVQNATRHAWRNGSDAPAVLAFVNLGAPQETCPDPGTPAEG
jgi:hypothetical protein